MGALSPWHWLVVLVIVLLLFGPKKLPEVGKGLGQAIRGFKEGLSGKDKDEESKEKPPADGSAEDKPPQSKPELKG